MYEGVNTFIVGLSIVVIIWGMIILTTIVVDTVKPLKKLRELYKKKGT